MAVNVNTALFCSVTPCSLAEEACCHVPEYSSLKYVIPFVVNLRRFLLMDFVLCSGNNSNYSGNCLNYLLRIILFFLRNSKKPIYLAQYSDYTVRLTTEKSVSIPGKGDNFSYLHSTTQSLIYRVPEETSKAS